MNTYDLAPVNDNFVALLSDARLDIGRVRTRD